MKKTMKFLLSLVLTMTMFLPANANTIKNDKLTILFTHDMHDNLESYSVEVDKKIQSRGGFARLYTAILEERSLDPQLLLVDAGDYSMGTLFQTIFTSKAPTLRLMGKMGYDATTLGNHEFDFRPQGLAQSLRAAKDSGDPLPEIVASNTSFPTDSDAELKDLQQAFKEYGIKDYHIVNKNGIKIGLFGLMGYEADSNAPMARVVFDDMLEESKRVVKILKEEEKVDMVIALSHSGTDGDEGESEDEILAKEVLGIDVIISGHSHTTLNNPIQINDTLIVSAGRYAENLGKLIVAKDDNKWTLEEYTLKTIDSSYQDHQELVSIIEDYKKDIDEEYLSLYNLSYDQVVAHAPFNFTPAAKLGKKQQEEPLANMIGDAYIYAVKEAEKANYKDIDIAVVPKGIIRDSIVAGDLTVKDIFNITPLGVGKDKISGYPLLDVYLTGKELQTAAEVDASIQPLMSAAQLYITGLQYHFNPNRLIFNKVTQVNLVQNDKIVDLENDKLYRVVANLYTAQMLNIVGDKSMGLLSIVPKDENGNVVENFEDRIIYSGDQEVKEWVAVTNYIQSFDKKDGVAQIDERYANFEGRKIVNDNKDLKSRIEKPNLIALAIYLIILVIITLILILIRFILRKVRKRRKLQPNN